jgi:hypothetical protein
MSRKATGNPTGRPAFKPTAEDRKVVSMTAANGMDQGRIARIIGGGISENTLTKYFREELDTSAIKAEAQMGGAVFNKALAGDVGLMKYWMNCRAPGWSDKPAEEVPPAREQIIIQINFVPAKPIAQSSDPKTIEAVFRKVGD